MRERPPAALTVALTALRERRPDLALDVRWHASLPSTMDAVAQAAVEGAAAGLVVIADQQTSGRGRRGNAWSSPPGAGLYFSYLARPAVRVELLTLAAGVGVLDGLVAATGVHAHLKWPNDVLVGSRKLAGVLAEGEQVGTGQAAVTVGVGVNIEPAAHPDDVSARATSLQAALGRPVARFAVFTAVLEHLSDALRLLDAGGASDILRRWRAASPTSVGTTVTWSDGGIEKQGRTEGIDDAGALIVRTPGRFERITSGTLDWDLR